MRTERIAAAVCAGAAAVSLPLALGAPRSGVVGRIPALKRIEFERVAAPAAPGPAKARGFRFRREPGWRRGIIETGFAPFPELLYGIVNQWQDVVGGRHVNVYAGRLGSDPRRGVVVVQATPVGAPTPGRPVAVRTPGRNGALRITRARGTVLELRSSHGRTWVFDVRSRRLLSTGGG